VVGSRKWKSYTKAVTKLFKNRDISISYRTKNNIKHLLTIKETKKKYNLSGVYQLRCTECLKRYVGQTGRTFESRYKEHIRYIKNNETNSKFSQHILDTTREYGTIEKIMKPLHFSKEGSLLDTYERLHIYEVTKQKLQLNDNYTEMYNPIYNTVISAYQNT
jgi:hypothetical protein